MGSTQSRNATGTDRHAILPDKDPLTSSGEHSIVSAVGRRIIRSEIGRDLDITPQVLGTGYSGAVRKAVHRSSGAHMAVKTFSKKRLKANRIELLKSEVEVYLRLDHPNVCRLLHAYEGKNEVWLVMELCGCELYNRLCERKAYRESDAVDVAHQMLLAVKYLHSHRIVHRDLKLENWMYGVNRGDDRIKLIDFGFSRILKDEDEELEMPCGTLLYTSPEVLRRKYTSKCDIWSLGVICYMMLVGRPPFRAHNNTGIAKAIVGDDFPREWRFEQLSEDAKDFLTQLMTKDASKRPDAAQALSHRWITSADAGSSSEVGIEVLTSLQKFARGSHLRRAGLTVMAYSLTSHEIQDLERIFLTFDKSGSGTITLQVLAEVMHEHLEVSSEEVERIFQCLDFANDEEVHYTPFIAGMLATRVSIHQDKVRTAFDAFDTEGTGFITAESLVRIFSTLPGQGSSGGLSRDEAEQWIREVDLKGNGVIDYDVFLKALTGQSTNISLFLQEDDDAPTVQVFDSGGSSRARSQTDHCLPTCRPQSQSDTILRRIQIKNGLAAALVDADIDDIEETGERKVVGQTFPAARSPLETPVVRVRQVASIIDERYFT